MTDARGFAARAVGALLLVLLLTLAVGPLLAPIRDPDFFWHLRTGEWIWQHRALPGEFVGAAFSQGTPAETQRFTLTSYWLSQVALHLVHAAGGMAGIVVLRAVLFGALLALLVRRRTGDGLVFLALLLLAVAVLAAFPEERPQYLSFVFAALLLRLLDGFRGAATPAALHRRAAAVPLLLLVWANCHGGYVVGLGLLALTALGESLKQLHPRLEPLPPDRLRLLLASGAAALLVSFLNPNGGYVFRFAVLPAWLRASVSEYQSTIDIFRTFGAMEMVAYWLLLALTAVGIAAAWRNLDLTALLLTAVTGGLSFAQNRFLPFFVIVALPAAARALSLPRAVRAARVAAIAAALVSCGLLLGKAGWRPPEPERVGKVDRNIFPVDAAAFIERFGLGGNIFANAPWGGYLLWRLAPAKVFIDGRNVDPGLREDYQAILGDGSAGGGRLRRERFAAAGIHLTVSDFYDPFTGALRGLMDDLMGDPAWVPVYASPRVLVFAESGAQDPRTIARIAIPKAEFASLLLGYCSRLIAETPDHAPPYVAQGDLLLRVGDREGALRSWREALRVAPGHELARARIGTLGVGG